MWSLMVIVFNGVPSIGLRHTSAGSIALAELVVFEAFTLFILLYLMRFYFRFVMRCTQN